MSKEAESKFAGGRWTWNRYRQFIVSALRKAWMKYPVKQDVLVSARREACGETMLRHPGTKYEYQCAICGNWFRGKEVQVDHKNDCDTSDLNRYVAHLFCEEDRLQCCCKGCHRIKTQAERAAKKKQKTI